MPWIERYENVTVLIFDIAPGELVHRIHAYAPTYEYDEWECDPHLFFARAEDGYLCAWFSNPMTLTSYGANTNKELISDGLKHAVVIKCGSKAEFGSFTQFKALMKSADRTWDGDKSVKFTDPQYGTFEVIDADSFLLNEKEVAYDARDQFLLKRTELVRV